VYTVVNVEMDDRDLHVFEQARPSLLGLAYRLLGSRADAEDVVQDCFLKWRNADRASIVEPGAWLSTACTRRCLDVLHAAHRARVDYVGPWLPEPIHRIVPPGADGKLAASLTTAFLLMLQRLTPRERAAYLLREVFDQPYAQIAVALDMEEAACRQLVSRARAHIERDKVRHVTPIATQDQLLRAFEAAITSGDTAQLTEMLSSDIRLTTDSGGKASAVLRVLEGEEVLLVLRRAHTWWKGCSWTFADLGGGRGAILTQDGQAILTLSFGYNEVDQVTDIFITRNPDKLTRLDPIVLT
jgi:RNA polymerase sigma factor (sigma-70 family)